MSAVAAGTAWFCIPGGSVLPCRKRSMKTRMAAIRWSSRWHLFCRTFCGVYNSHSLYVDIRWRGRVDLLSFVSGFSDITPFILNLLQGTGNVPVSLITACSMLAIVSNIAVNMCYALFFSGKKESVAFVGVERLRLCHCRQCVPAVVFLLSVNQCAFFCFFF